MYCPYFTSVLKWPLIVLFFLAGCLYFPTQALSQNSKPAISVAFCRDCVPFQFVNQSGNPDGIILDYWKKWSKKTDIDITYIPASWNETIEMVHNGKADLHAGVGYSDERAKFLEYGAPICNTETHAFFHKDVYSPQMIRNIKAFRIGVLAGDKAESYLYHQYPDASIVKFETYDLMMQALKKGRIKVFAADKPTALYHLREHGMYQSFSYTPNQPLYSSTWRIAGGKDKDKLIEKINKGMENISLQEHRKITKKWSIPGYVEAPGSLVIAVPRGLPPFSMVGPDGEASGFLADFWRLWSKTTNVPIFLLSGSWEETVEYVRKGDADIHSGLLKNKKLAKWMDFSAPIYEAKTGLFFRSGEQDFKPLEKMARLKVGILAGSYQENYLKERYPEVIRVSYPDHQEMIMGLLQGETKAIIDVSPAVEAVLNLRGFKGTLGRHKDILFKQAVHAGLLKENAALKQMIDKGLKEIPNAGLIALEEKWLPDATDYFYKRKAYSLGLTDEEEVWIRAHPHIRIAATDNWPPMNFMTPSGSPAGIGTDYVKALNERLGNILEITPGPFKENLEKVKIHRADALLDVPPNPDRTAYLNFTRPYLTVPHVIVALKEGSYYSSEADLSGKTLALEKGFENVTYFKQTCPDVKIEKYPDTATALGAVVRGRADAYAGNRAVASWIMEQEIMSSLKIQGRLNKKESVLSIGVRKDWPELASILDKAMASIPEGQVLSIHRKWLRHDKSTHDVPFKLTPEENAWLDAHPYIRIAAMDAWPPMDFVNASGKPVGIGADLVRLLNKSLGGVLQIIPGPFKENMEKIKGGEMDALLDVTPMPYREEYLNFTTPYMTVPHVIVARKNGPYYEEETDLSGKILAIEKGFFSVKYFRDNYPDVTVVEYPDTSHALDAVAREQADAYAGNRAVASWIMGKEIMSTLEIQGRLNRKGSVLAIGVRKDWPELVAILEKALNTMPIGDLSSILRKWAGLDESKDLSKIRFTAAENAWMAKHSMSIVVGAETDWPPYDFAEDGQAVGYSNDLLRLVAKKTGLSLKFVIGESWPRLIEEFKAGKVDILPAVYKTPKREKTMAFTRSYAANPEVLLVHENQTQIRSFADLSNKKLAFPKGFSIAEHLLEKRPDISPVPVSNVLSGLKAVSLKKADAFVGSLGVISYFLKENLVPGLRIIDEVVLEKEDVTKLHIAMKKDQLILKGIIQKGLDAITESEQNKLRKKWLGSALVGLKKERLALTAQERSWLKLAAPVRMAVDPSWLPIEHINPETKTYEGIAADYIRLLSKITGITFKLVPTPDWQESLNLAREGKVDMLAACSKTPERDEFIDFSNPYLTVSNAVVVRNNTPFLHDVGELAGKRVAVNEGTSIHRYLKKNYPELILVPNKGSLNGLKMVANNEVDAFVDTLEVVGYLINNQGLFNLKVALRLPKKRELRIGLRKGLSPELLSVLNKGIQAVTAEEKSGFYRRWISLHVEESIDYTLLWKIGLPVTGGLLLIFGIISFWNRKLAKEILVRKKVEADLSNALGVITDSIRYASRIQRSVLPPKENMQDLLESHFVLWKPRDVVGGDIFWGAQWGNGVLILLADCTGHGVPGAFMTLISTGALERAMLDVQEGDAGALIQTMHHYVQATLSQDSENLNKDRSDDGLELGICYLPKDGQTITFAGAGFPLFITEDKGIKMIKGDRKGIGYRAIPADTVWSNHVITVKKGTSFYMSSDGIFDQVGGLKRMGFGKKRFKKLLADVQNLPVAEQGKAIYKELTSYQGDESRRDDISAIGFKL